MVIDIHTHIWAAHVEKDKAEMRKAMEMYDIEKIYVSGLKSYFSDEEEIDFLNDEVYKFMREEPGRVGGAVYLNPMNNNTMDVIKRAIEERGFELIKLWVCTHADVPEVDPIMDYAEANGIPVLLHAFHKATGQVPNETTGIHVANIARRHPKAKIIMAHLGGNCYNGVPAIRNCPNVWCDYCGSIFRGDEVNYAVEYLGVDRLLFGTDMPGSYLVNVGQVLGADLTEEDRDKIFYHNAKKILDRNFRL